jgi:hypothetical protein
MGHKYSYHSASLFWTHWLSHGNLHFQLTISKYESHPNSYKSILGSCTKRGGGKKPQTTHCRYILTILWLFWSQMNSLQSSHINGRSFLATQNPQYPDNVVFHSTPIQLPWKIALKTFQIFIIFFNRSLHYAF